MKKKKAKLEETEHKIFWTLNSLKGRYVLTKPNILLWFQLLFFWKFQLRVFFNLSVFCNYYITLVCIIVKMKFQNYAPTLSENFLRFLLCVPGVHDACMWESINQDWFFACSVIVSWVTSLKWHILPANHMMQVVF